MLGQRNALTVLLYHGVPPRPDPLRPGDLDAAAFEAQMRVLARLYNPLGLNEALQLQARGQLPSRAVCVTFDDGYRNNYSVALPIMRRHRVPMALFVATGFLDGGRMWNDTVIEALRRARAGVLDLERLGLGRHRLSDDRDRATAAYAIINELKYRPVTQRQTRVDELATLVGEALPDDLMMSSEQVRELAGEGVEIGGHTVNHPILARLDDDRADDEICSGKAQLEELTGMPLRFFAYPNGRPQQDYRDEHTQMVARAGFEAALSTRSGTVRRTSDRFQLPRFSPWQESSWRLALRIAHMRTAA